MSKATDPSPPYTFADHARFIRSCMDLGVSASERLVQVRKYPFQYCAKIMDAFTIIDGPDCFKVQTLEEGAIFSVPVKNVRACGGFDCTCEASETEGTRLRGGAVADRPEGFTCL